MDYTLAALKLFCEQLKYARPTSSPSAMTLGGVLFQRAWLQGVLVSGQDEGCYILDDGTDVIELQLTNEFQQEQWKTGMYVMVIGLYVARPEELPVIKVHKIVDLSPQPDREAMWHLEVIEAYKLFCQPSVENEALQPLFDECTLNPLLVVLLSCEENFVFIESCGLSTHQMSLYTFLLEAD